MNITTPLCNQTICYYEQNKLFLNMTYTWRWHLELKENAIQSYINFNILTWQVMNIINNIINLFSNFSWLLSKDFYFSYRLFIKYTTTTCWSGHIFFINSLMNNSFNDFRFYLSMLLTNYLAIDYFINYYLL